MSAAVQASAHRGDELADLRASVAVGVAGVATGNVGDTEGDPDDGDELVYSHPTVAVAVADADASGVFGQCAGRSR